jgi:hypothetical protein
VFKHNMLFLHTGYFYFKFPAMAKQTNLNNSHLASLYVTVAEMNNGRFSEVHF